VVAGCPHSAGRSRAPRARAGPAKHATENTNSPSEDDVQAAVANIEQCYTDLASERGVYMTKCKRIRETMAGDYDKASDQGISKKLLKKIIKERELERKIGALTDDLEDDERSEHQMLMEKLGEFANTPLGKAALSQASGADVLAQAGA
jgi:Skp family chaperone for outer membrane proteins